jgi:hypothetical protein
MMVADLSKPVENQSADLGGKAWSQIQILVHRTQPV